MGETMPRTPRMEDLRLFAQVAEARSFTAAARVLGVPKQTLSRRVAELEETLGAKLCHRSTRKLTMTDVGAAFAARCSEIVRLAEEAARAVTDAQTVPRGTLRITADPVFGDAFVTRLVVEYARRWPEVEIDVVLTRRKVDLVEEGFDVAFRVGRPEDPALIARNLGAARVRYCASPAYLRKHGRPARPADLGKHRCLLVTSDSGPVRWPFRGDGAGGMTLVPVTGRLRFSSFAMARAAALAGLGIGIFPEFACADDLSRRRLTTVLDDWLVDVGAVWLLHPPSKLVPARVRAFVDLVLEPRFAWTRRRTDQR